MENIIDQLKKRLIEDIAIIERTRAAKQNIIYNNIIHIESPDERRLRELAEEIERDQMKKYLEIKKEHERLNQEAMEKIKRDQEKWIKELRSKNKS
jgi:DNA repair photolyase